MSYAIRYFAQASQAYGSGNYSSSCYSYSSSCTTGTSSGSGSTSVLTNTGFDVLLAVTVAAVIIFAALTVRFVKKRPHHKKDKV